MLGPDEPDSELRAVAAEKLGIAVEEIAGLELVRRSIDARGGAVRFVNTVEAVLSSAEAEADAVAAGRAAPVAAPEELRPTPGTEAIRGRIVVAGGGPAGLFAAWLLSGYGYRPVVLERGAAVEERHADIERFLSTRTLDPDSNLVFGAGGAGAYSDGKLYTRIRDPRSRLVLERLIAFGAPPEIAIDGRPHVGTDLLRGIIGALCREMEGRGVEFRWRTRLTGLEIQEGRLRAVETPAGRIETNCLLLATGANARDSFRPLFSAGLDMAPKPFQMGVRIEHPRELIDKAIYGRWAGHPRLGAADYVLSGSGVASFCVCPGGFLVPASSEPETVCTNGMSLLARDGAFTNGALVTTIQPAEFGGGPLDGLDYQRRWEHDAFMAGGGDYSAPAQRASDFLKGRLRALGGSTSYPFGVKAARMEALLPKSVGAAVATALRAFEKRIPGFAGEAAVLVGPEARASCPVRILRDRERMASPSADGVYPAGEGSGYASGIMSSAVDGLRAAEAIIARFAAPARA